jgi:DNA-binding NarL/FixJ family response regulator
MHRTQILLVEDDVLFREALARLLDSEADLSVTGQCGAPAEALERIAGAPPDLVMIDANVGFDAAQYIVTGARRAGYQGRFLLMTAALHPRWSVKALQAGVSGIFLRSRGLEKLLRAIRLVAAGEAWVERDTIELLAHGVGEALSDRENEVLRGVLDGLTNKMIANRMGVPEATVKAALRRVFRWSGVRSRAQLIRAALEGRAGLSANSA